MDLRINYLLFVLCLGTGFAQAQNTTVDKGKCINDLRGWCDRNNYNNTGMSVSSIGYFDNGRLVRIYCYSDSNGSQCYQNMSPWYACFANKTVTFDGKPLDDGVDDSVCEASEHALNTPNFNSTAFEEEFKKGMEDFQKQMQELQKSLSEEFGKIFGPNFPFDKKR